MKEKLEILKQKNKEIKRLKGEMHQISKDMFLETSKEIFNKYPKLESFCWSQFTPYFNDGSPCVFEANIDYIAINGEVADESDWICENNVISWGNWNSINKNYDDRVEEPNPNYDKDLALATAAVRDFLSYFDNDFYLSQFGDHSEITLKRCGEIVVEEIEHD
jgi:hypothetical protein